MIESARLKACFCHFIEWDSSTGLKSIAASHMSQGSGIVGPRLATHPPASLKVACVQIRARTGCVRAPLDTVPHLYANTTGTSRRGAPTLAAFACAQQPH